MCASSSIHARDIRTWLLNWIFKIICLNIYHNVYKIIFIYQDTYVTGFVKIDPYCSRTEIHFIAEHQSLTLALPRNAKHMAIDSQVCFHRCNFAVPVRSSKCTTGSPTLPLLSYYSRVSHKNSWVTHMWVSSLNSAVL